jgi:hypothetical protein
LSSRLLKEGSSRPAVKPSAGLRYARPQSRSGRRDHDAQGRFARRRFLFVAGHSPWIGVRAVEDGKLSHTNDKACELAHFFALLADSSYCQDKATERILEQKKATLEAELERLRREYRIALIDYERAQLGSRDAA